VKARSYKHFNKEQFAKDIEEAPWSVFSIFDDPDDCYGAWLNIFNDICDNIIVNSVSFVSTGTFNHVFPSLPMPTLLSSKFPREI
jgi:hypothetical protein